MSYSTFGYGSGYPSSSSQLVTGAPTTSPGSTGSGSNLSPSCGEGGPAVSPLSAARTGSGMTDPMTGQLLDSSSLAALSYPRLGGGMGALGTGMYGTSYPSTEQNPYPSISMENSAFYGSLTNPYGMKDGGGGTDMGAWGSAALPPTAGYYSYDHPTLAAYGYGGGYDLAARRKNATRESTATLKAWLNEHKKNPYPTKGEKIMLAIITKMTLTQVSTWFANARRRLKKENKMTWEPKNKLDDEDVDVSDDEDKDNSFSRDDKSDNDDDPRREMGHHGMTRPDDKDDSKEGIPIPPSKPKIWSMAELAVCKTPPPPNAAHGNPWQAMQHGFGLDANLVRQNPAMAAAALRSNMFGMGRAQDPSTYPGLHEGQHEAKVQHPSISPSVSALTGSSELQTETPPQTPPNGVKMGANLGMGNNVINMNNSGSGYQNPYQSQYGSLNSSMHSFEESPNKSLGQYAQHSSNSISNMPNNLYNGNVSRI